MAKLCPSRSSIVVRASRLVSDWNRGARNHDGVLIVEFAHRRVSAQINDSTGENGRDECQLHAVMDSTV